MNGNESVRKDIRERLRGDLRPVTPIAPPWRRALDLAPWTVVAVACVLGLFGLRVDHAEVGPFGVWGGTLIFVGAAYVLLTVVARERIPGAGLPLGSIAAGVVLLVAARIGLAALTEAQRPLLPPPGSSVRLVIACTGAILLFGSPLLLLVWHACRRALPTRPALCGLLAGLGSGVAAETIWRLHCPYSDLLHLVTAHFLPVALLAAAGSVLVWRSMRRG